MSWGRSADDAAEGRTPLSEWAILAILMPTLAIMFAASFCGFQPSAKDLLIAPGRSVVVEFVAGEHDLCWTTPPGRVIRNEPDEIHLRVAATSGEPIPVQPIHHDYGGGFWGRGYIYNCYWTIDLPRRQRLTLSVDTDGLVRSSDRLLVPGDSLG